MDKYCSNCGSKLPEGADVCVKCGKLVSHNTYNGVSGKSKILAAVLAFFLGSFGVHNFYLGYTSKGVAQLALTIVGYMLLIILVGALFLIATGIWAFVEFVLLLTGGISTDASGNKLV